MVTEGASRELTIERQYGIFEILTREKSRLFSLLKAVGKIFPNILIRMLFFCKMQCLNFLVTI